jgi:hypothetical protein
MEKRIKIPTALDRTGQTPPRAGSKIRMVTTVFGLFIAIAAAGQLITRKDEEMAGAARVTDCDRLAAHPSDTQKLSPGIVQAEVDIPAARKACHIAHDQSPGDGRILYQLGRTYFYAKDYDKGIAYFRQSDASGYAQGQFVLGLIMVQGNGTEPDAKAAHCGSKPRANGTCIPKFSSPIIGLMTYLPIANSTSPSRKSTAWSRRLRNWPTRPPNTKTSPPCAKTGKAGSGNDKTQ